MKLQDLNALLDPVRIILATLQSNGHGGAAAFREELASLSDGDLMSLNRSADSARLALAQLERQIEITLHKYS